MPKAHKLSVNLEDFFQRYLEGEGAPKLAKELGVSKVWFYRALKDWHNKKKGIITAPQPKASDMLPIGVGNYSTTQRTS